MEYLKLHTPHASFSPTLMPIKRKVHYYWKSEDWVNGYKKCYLK